MRLHRRALIALALPISMAVGVSTAHAAAPAHDTFGGALTVPIGYSEYLDTTEATTDAVDAELNACFPATDASVWYSITGDGTDVIVDVTLTSYNSYSAGVIVVAGTPGNFQQVACGAYVQFLSESGTTYYVLAVDTQLDGGGNGGFLQMSILHAPTLVVTVNSVGQVDPRTGVATIGGTYTCAGPDYVSISLDLRQNVGRFTIFGYNYYTDVGTCDGTAHNWSTSLITQNGKFAGGKSLATMSANACGPTGCAFSSSEQTIQLRSSKI
jgi:hypothetical protein